MSCNTSIIIPVCEKWALTEACLRSLASTLPRVRCEIHVIDNGSHDETGNACPALGQALFGPNFFYHPFAENHNFGPASNFGARCAQGEFLLFLNNETVLLPGWHEPLLHDFTVYPHLAATGPLLMRPGGTVLGPTVQHLGVYISPTGHIDHLYEGIPAATPLAGKRRFFQVITAACMLIPRQLFLTQGGFDEKYAHGFEDVDLCARLVKQGYRMTVNPEARMYHLGDSTPAKQAHMQKNLIRLRQKSWSFLKTDWFDQLQEDRLELKLTRWLHWIPCPEHAKRATLQALLSRDEDTLKTVLMGNPLWYEGYTQLTRLLTARGAWKDAFEVCMAQALVTPGPKPWLMMFDICEHTNNDSVKTEIFSNLLQYCNTPTYYQRKNANTRAALKACGMDNMVEQCDEWGRLFSSFTPDVLMPLYRKVLPHLPHYYLLPSFPHAYMLWQGLGMSALHCPSQKSEFPRDDMPPTLFSILMPIYNPNYEYLRDAVDSLYAQTWQNWELCIADDCSSNTEVRDILNALTHEDKRIRVVFRLHNGHIASATNTALDMACGDFAVLMDQDDTLESDALELAAERIAHCPDVQLLFSDEDKINSDTMLMAPYFKPHIWDEELIRGQNYVSHLGIYRMLRLREIGGFRNGFPASQDYDMLLRFIDRIPRTHIVHIPKVLYHWRIHAGSTAYSVECKPEAKQSAQAALRENLAQQGVQAKVGASYCSDFMYVHYQPPSPLPKVSLLIDGGSDTSRLLKTYDAIAGGTKYSNLEILILYDAAKMPAKCLNKRYSKKLPVRFVPVTPNLNYAEKVNQAVKQVESDIIGFWGTEIRPVEPHWCQDIVGHLSQPGVGAVGGKLIDGAHAAVASTGYVVDADGALFALFQGLPRTAAGYSGWPHLARTVAALDPRNLFVHRVTFNAMNGFDPFMGEVAPLDFCLRLRQRSLRVVIEAGVEFYVEEQSAGAWEHNGQVTDTRLLFRWQGQLEPCIPALRQGWQTWALHWIE